MELNALKLYIDCLISKQTGIADVSEVKIRNKLHKFIDNARDNCADHKQLVKLNNFMVSFLAACSKVSNIEYDYEINPFLNTMTFDIFSSTDDYAEIKESIVGMIPLSDTFIISKSDPYEWHIQYQIVLNPNNPY